MNRLDGTDERILRLLRENGRISNADLAAAIGLSPSACLRRVRALEAGGTIRGYTAVLEERGGNHQVVVIVRITLERQTDECLSRFEQAARRCAEIRECYLMTGDSDYLLRIVVEDAAGYERLHRDVLSRLPGVSRIQSSFTIRTVIRPVDM
ncbi:Lrp/AsnC family transcriptional regulator [Roseomonas elaeocarpi]|uniref:Lrp/AsnC family transcriptional regulator n=1 Tax=Roseomonas elaeocarpi TaxID=907779 RepID=A0ABV6JRI7_9PROT